RRIPPPDDLVPEGARPEELIQENPDIRGHLRPQVDVEAARVAEELPDQDEAGVEHLEVAGEALGPAILVGHGVGRVGAPPAPEGPLQAKGWVDVDQIDPPPPGLEKVGGHMEVLPPVELARLNLWGAPPLGQPETGLDLAGLGQNLLRRGLARPVEGGAGGPSAEGGPVRAGQRLHPPWQGRRRAPSPPPRAGVPG